MPPFFFFFFNENVPGVNIPKSMCSKRIQPILCSKKKKKKIYRQLSSLSLNFKFNKDIVQNLSPQTYVYVKEDIFFLKKKMKTNNMIKQDLVSNAN